MTDPKTIAIAVVGGLVPALIWLWFWLREDKEKPEPKGLLALTFIGGMAAVIFVLPLEKFANTHIANQTTLLVVWSALEEIAKFAIVALIALKTPFANEPIDYPIYFITTALGFAALENTLFLFPFFKERIMRTMIGFKNIKISAYNSKIRRRSIFQSPNNAVMVKRVNL